MMKYAGIILLAGAISMYGAHMSFAVRDEIAVRKALYDLLIHIKCCIDNGALPLNEIYALFENAVLEKYGFIQQLKNGETGAFKNAVNDSGIKLSPEMKQLYVQLAESLGKSRFRTAESEMLSRYMSLIQLEETKLIKKDEARQELYRKLGILCGLLAALVLI